MSSVRHINIHASEPLVKFLNQIKKEDVRGGFKANYGCYDLERIDELCDKSNRLHNLKKSLYKLTRSPMGETIHKDFTMELNSHSFKSLENFVKFMELRNAS